MTPEPLIIQGRQRDTGIYEDVLNPYDGSLVGRVSVGRAEDMDDAIAGAADAFRMTRSMATHQRASILERTSGLLAEQAESLARLMVHSSTSFCSDSWRRPVR
jgi:acyl-CoA reductase-like NAD-dependent aldehyde dehydrogenase